MQCVFTSFTSFDPSLTIVLTAFKAGQEWAFAGFFIGEELILTAAVPSLGLGPVSLGLRPPPPHPHITGYRIQDIDWLGLSASVLAGEGFPQPGPERPK